MTQPDPDYIDFVASHWLDDPVRLGLWALLALVPFAGLALGAPWQWYPLAAAYLLYLLRLSTHEGPSMLQRLKRALRRSR